MVSCRSESDFTTSFSLRLTITAVRTLSRSSTLYGMSAEGRHSLIRAFKSFFKAIPPFGKISCPSMRNEANIQVQTGDQISKQNYILRTVNRLFTLLGDKGQRAADTFTSFLIASFLVSPLFRKHRCLQWLPQPSVH